MKTWNIIKYPDILILLSDTADPDRCGYFPYTIALYDRYTKIIMSTLKIYVYTLCLNLASFNCHNGIQMEKIISDFRWI